jgi:hypothetical protein
VAKWDGALAPADTDLQTTGDVLHAPTSRIEESSPSSA